MAMNISYIMDAHSLLNINQFIALTSTKGNEKTILLLRETGAKEMLYLQHNKTLSMVLCVSTLRKEYYHRLLTAMRC